MAEQVSLRLIAAGELIDAEPEVALAHTLVARRLASRISAVREAVGLAAYRAGQWQTAIGELRAYHRLTGRQSHVGAIADCERALGRAERAIDLYRAADRSQLTAEEAAELLIVAAGARADLGQRDAAVAMLQVRELTADEPWVARLRYAYADALLAVGRREEGREWFARAAEIDLDATTDAAERLLELDGVVLDDADDDLDDAVDGEDISGEGISDEGISDEGVSHEGISGEDMVGEGLADKHTADKHTADGHTADGPVGGSNIGNDDVGADDIDDTDITDTDIDNVHVDKIDIDELDMDEADMDEDDLADKDVDSGDIGEADEKLHGSGDGDDATGSTPS